MMGVPAGHVVKAQSMTETDGNMTDSMDNMTGDDNSTGGSISGVRG
jgi:hypothetical protein